MAQHSMDSDRLSSAGLSTHSSGTAGTVGGSVVGVRPGENGLKRNNEDEYNLGPLPPMWEKAFTPTGEVYFIDHNAGTSHWLDPRLARVRKHSLGECGEDELPYGWERVTDERYGCYYVDHINRRTQYENPVLQARRLRAEKMAAENSNMNNNPPPITTPTGELKGERFSLTLTKGTQGLGFTLIGAEGAPETEGYLQIRSIVPHSPAWIDGGLRAGDVLMGVSGRGVRGLSHAQVARIFQGIPPDTPVSLHLLRGYPLPFDSEDPNTRVLSTLAVDSNPVQPDAVAMQQLTRALRTRFNLDSPKTENTSLDEPDTSPKSPMSPSERRLLSRSFDLDELPTASSEVSHVPPRCPSADHLLTLATDSSRGNNNISEPSRELSLVLRRGAAGFGFTIADSVHGQKVKKVLDRSRCAGLREGDLLLQIGDTDVRHMAHQHVVQVLKECPAMSETGLRVCRRAAAAVPAALNRPPRSRSATRPPASMSTTNNNNNLGRSKTPTAEQLRSPTLHTHNMSIHDRLNDINNDAEYAVPEQKQASLLERRRRNSTPGSALNAPLVPTWNQPHDQNQWQEREGWIDNSSNVRNWAENQKWNENGNKWDENGQKWNGNEPKWDANGQKWNGNEPKWDANGQKWNGNGPKWDENGQKWNGNGQKWDDRVNANGNPAMGWDHNGDRWSGGGWGEVGTPTVHVDLGTQYWRGDSLADSSDNGGFPEDGMLNSPTTAAISGMTSHRHSPSNRLRPHSPTNSGGINSSCNVGADRMMTNSPSSRLRSQSPSNNSSSGRVKRSPMRVQSGSPRGRVHSPVSHRSYEHDLQQGPVYAPNYQQMEGVCGDRVADVVVRVCRGGAGFGFRIVGGTEDGTRVAVGHVVPGGPAEGLLRGGDLLTSVDGVSVCGASHARAVALVSQAAHRGHVTLGIRHNRADVQPLGLPNIDPHQHQALLAAPPPAAYNILHPAPLYPTQPTHMYGSQYEGGWSAPYDVCVTRNEGEGFGFVVISSTNKATTTIGQLIPNSPAARCGMLHVGDTIIAINHVPIRNVPHPEVVALIKQSGTTVTLTVDRHAMD